jgi:hypothetical protein
MYTARHNAAGRLILKGILKYSTTHYQLLSTDCGSSHKWAHTTKSNRLPTAHIPPPTHFDTPQKTNHKLLLHSSRPDLTLCTPLPNGRKHITIVELKFTKDTNHEETLCRARAQHQQLMTYLSELGHKTTLIPILLGNGGTIFNIHTFQALKNLGIPTPQIGKMCKKLHILALHHLHSIVSLRRQLESSPGPNKRMGSSLKRPSKRRG